VKVNLPGRAVPDVAAAQRRELRDAADRIERGARLTAAQTMLAPAALRAFAKRIPDVERRPRGRPRYKLDPLWVSLMYHKLHVTQGLPKGAAVDRLCELTGVSESAIKAHLPRVKAATK
jgi:hypothetical protein